MAPCTSGLLACAVTLLNGTAKDPRGLPLRFTSLSYSTSRFAPGASWLRSSSRTVVDVGANRYSAYAGAALGGCLADVRLGLVIDVNWAGPKRKHAANIRPVG